MNLLSICPAGSTLRWGRFSQAFIRHTLQFAPNPIQESTHPAALQISLTLMKNPAWMQWQTVRVAANGISPYPTQVGKLPIESNKLNFLTFGGITYLCKARKHGKWPKSAGFGAQDRMMGAHLMSSPFILPKVYFLWTWNFHTTHPWC